MHRPVLVTPPELLPVTLEEAKAHLRVEFDDDDNLIKTLIAAATNHLDGWTGILGRCLVQQEWRQDYDAVAACLPLPLGPVLETMKVTVAGEIIDPQNYALVTDAGGRSLIKLGGALSSGAVTVTYRAGYPTLSGDGEDKSMVPAALKVAILLLIAHWYQNRETVVTGTIATALPFAAEALLKPFYVR